MSDRAVFADIYRDNTWDYGSGPGSSPEYTALYRGVLEQFLRANDIRSVVDVGCGDWQFSQLVNWHGAHYTGYDVVPSVIERNRTRFQQADIRFHDMPANYRDIASADLILCKDVLQHLSLVHAEKLLAALERRGKFVLITNCVLPLDRLNMEIEDGDWRPLDIAADPFQRRPVNLGVFHTKKMQLLTPGLR